MAYGAKRAPVKKRKGPIEQFAEDITHGVPKLIESGKMVFTKVQEGGRKVLNFLKNK